MTLLEKKLKFLELDPDEVIGVDMDCYCPYNTFSYPGEFDDDDELHDWICSDYITTIQGCGRVEGIEQLRKELMMETIGRLNE